LSAGLSAAALRFSAPDIPYEVLDQRYGAATYRSLSLPLSGGVELKYRDMGDPEGPVMVLVHGFAASSADFDPVVARLGACYRIIAPDLPGQGLTEGPAEGRLSVAGDVAVLGALIRDLDLSDVVLVGSSLGGQVAFNLALADPGRFSALVLVDAAGWPSPLQGETRGAAALVLDLPGARRAMAQLDPRPFARAGLKAAFVDQTLVSPALIARYADLARAPGRRRLLLTMRIRASDAASKQRLQRLHTPTLILTGALDRLVPPRNARLFAEAVPGAKLQVLPKVGHLPLQEDPDDAVRAIQGFLADQRLGAFSASRPVRPDEDGPTPSLAPGGVPWTPGPPGAPPPLTPGLCSAPLGASSPNGPTGSARPAGSG
jgi:pimeloyl-ACP methyl ester carboxylesterase